MIQWSFEDFNRVKQSIHIDGEAAFAEFFYTWETNLAVQLDNSLREDHSPISVVEDHSGRRPRKVDPEAARDLKAMIQTLDGQLKPIGTLQTHLYMGEATPEHVRQALAKFQVFQQEADELIRTINDLHDMDRNFKKVHKQAVDKMKSAVRKVVDWAESFEEDLERLLDQQVGASRRRSSQRHRPRLRQPRTAGSPPREVQEPLNQILDQSTQLKSLLMGQDNLEGWVVTQVAEAASKLEEVFSHLKYDHDGVGSRRAKFEQGDDQIRRAFDMLARTWEDYLEQHGYLGPSTEVEHPQRDGEMQRSDDTTLDIRLDGFKNRTSGPLKVQYYTYWNDRHAKMVFQMTITLQGRKLFDEKVRLFERMSPQEMAETLFDKAQAVLRGQGIYLS